MRKVESIHKECQTYCRYLAGQEANSYILQKYAEFYRGHAATALEDGGFDRLLLRASAIHPLLTRLADCYACRFRPHSPVRQRLVMMLALLECTPPFFDRLDAPSSGGPTSFYLQTAAAVLRHVAALCVATVVFAPAHVWFLAFGRVSKRGNV